MQDLNAMFLFAKVVDHGGYTAAARVLGLQTSKLSRRITDLETELGVRLLNRTTRKMSLTEVGHTYYAHCAALVAEAEAAKESVDRTRASPQGLVRVSCPVPLMHSNVGLIVSHYLRDNADVRVHVEATNRRIDLIDREPPLVAFAALGKARLFIGADSGVMHLAAAAGAPTLGLFGPSDERLYAPWGEHVGAVRGPRTFAEIKAQDGRLNHPVCHMTDLRASAVIAAARKLLARSEGATAFTPAGEVHA